MNLPRHLFSVISRASVHSFHKSYIVKFRQAGVNGVISTYWRGSPSQAIGWRHSMRKNSSSSWGRDLDGLAVSSVDTSVVNESSGKVSERVLQATQSVLSIKDRTFMTFDWQLHVFCKPHNQCYQLMAEHLWRLIDSCTCSASHIHN